MNVNETNPTTFEYEMLDANQFELMQQDDPFITNEEEQTIILDQDEISSNWLAWNELVYDNPSATSSGNAVAYAETWDMDVTESTFAQFQLIITHQMQEKSITAQIRFEFSTDMGRHWQLVESHPDQLASDYTLSGANNGTRITVHLPKQAMSAPLFNFIITICSN